MISVSIGQGEVLATPLQIANLAATIANRGYYFTPHVVRSVENTYLGDDFSRPHYTGVDPSYYELIVAGMRMSMIQGTCRIGEIPGIEACGKTGTAQNPHGKDRCCVCRECRLGCGLWSPYRQPDDGEVFDRRDSSFAQMARRAYAKCQYNDTRRGGR